MRVRGSGGATRGWLACMVWTLLEEKYGKGRVPAVRKISADIRAATGGETISHGHINNILLGEACNLTDGKRRVLAAFFGKQPSVFDQPAPPDPHSLDELDGLASLDGAAISPGCCAVAAAAGPDSWAVRALAFRFATMEPAQIAAIEKALRIAKGETPD